MGARGRNREAQVAAGLKARQSNWGMHGVGPQPGRQPYNATPREGSKAGWHVMAAR